jgi:hypothetical protein
MKLKIKIIGTRGYATKPDSAYLCEIKKSEIEKLLGLYDTKDQFLLQHQTVWVNCEEKASDFEDEIESLKM